MTLNIQPGTIGLKTNKPAAKAVGLVGLLCALAVPALAGPPFDVDDPGTAEYQHIEENTNYYTTQVSGTRIDTAATEVNYGYSKNIELTLGSGVSMLRQRDAATTRGLGDTSAEIKWRFHDETAKTPGVSIHYALNIPTGSAVNGLGSGGYDHTFQLESGKQIKRAYVYGNLGTVLPGAAGGRNSAFLGGVYSYQLTPTTVIGAELYGTTSPAVGARGDLACGVGVTRDILPDRTLMLQVGRSTMGSADLNVYAGIQFVLDTRRHRAGEKEAADGKGADDAKAPADAESAAKN